MQVIENRKWFYILSLVLLIPSILSLLIQGLNQGIDFKGGSIVYLSLSDEATVAGITEVVDELGLGSSEIQQSGKEFYIRTGELEQDQSDSLIGALQDKYNEVKLLSTETVGPAIGKELTRNAIIALIIATILMLIYIAFRFEWTFGIAAILAIIHNVVVVLGVCSLLRWEINSAFIAAVLTVVGFSINDTIVIFDRVRENIRIKRRESYDVLLNTSVTQTINRSINVVLVVTFPLVALILFGGESIKLFAATMLIGFVVGAYTSIFIASPLWYELKTRFAL